MNTTKLIRLSLSLTFVVGISNFTPLLRADSILNLSQPLFDNGFSDIWGWQTITVPTVSTLTTFAFEWNGSSGDLGATATVDLLRGDGLGGTLLGSVTGSVVLDDQVLYPSDPYAGYRFFVANFGGVSLSPGQYTVSYHDATAPLQLVGLFDTAPTGNHYTGQGFGNLGGELTFFTPSPIGSSSSAVPEPSSFAMLGIGGLLVVGYAWRKKKQTALSGWRMF